MPQTHQPQKPLRPQISPPFPKTIAQYTYDSTNRMTQGVNDKNETSAYHTNSLGALIGETKHIAKDAYGYTGVDATPQPNCGK